MSKEVKKLRLTLVKSLIGRIQKHKETIRCLGLRRIRGSVEVDVNPSTMGRVNQVSYLLKIEELS